MDIGELIVRIGAIGESKKVKEFKKAVQEAGEAIEKYQKNLDKSEVSAKELAKAIGGAFKILGTTVSVVSGAYIAFDKLTSALTAQNLQWITLKNQSNLALETLQTWGNIGKITGVNNLTQQITDLEQKIYRARLLGENYEGFALAGVMPTNANDVMEQLRLRIKGLDNTQAKFLLEKMGLDTQLLNVLRMETDEIAEIQQITQRYSLTNKERKDIEKLRQQIELTRIKLQYFKDKAIMAILPAFAKFANSISNIIEMFIKLGIKLKPLIKFLTVLSFNAKSTQIIFSELSLTLSNLISKIPLFGTAFSGLAKIFSKTLLPLTALFYLLDDIAMYMQGGDSVIGRIINWGQEQGKGFSDAFSKIFGGDVFGGTIDLLRQTMEAIQDTLKALDKTLSALLNFFTFGFFNWAKKGLKGNYEDAVLKVTGRTVEDIEAGNVQDALGKSSQDNFANILPNNSKSEIRNSSKKTVNNTKISQYNTFQTNDSAQETYDQLTYLLPRFRTEFN